MNPTVTTIIPTFRRPAMLARAIRSALSQTYRDVRVCVYDNASGDETEQVVRGLAEGDSRVIYHCHPANIGGFENFLFGMRDVTTPLFSFLSDDDVLFPEFYERAVAALATHPEALLFAGSTLELDERGELLFAPLADWPHDGVYNPPDGAIRMLGNRHPTWTGVVFRRHVIEAVGVLDREVGAPSDLDYVMRVAARFPIVVSFDPCAAYVRHPLSHSANETAKIVPGFAKMIDNISADARIPEDARRFLRRRLEGQVRGKLLEISIKALVRGDSDGSREAALMLRDQHGSRLLGNALLAARAACTSVPPLHRALAWAEGLRLRARARRARARVAARAATPPPNYARYLEIPSL